MIVRRYNLWFDAVLAVPLALYALLLALMMVSMVGQITPEAVKVAFSEPSLRHAIWLSLTTSTLSTVLSLLVAVPAGYVLSRRQFRGHSLVDTVVDLPIVLPPLVMGLAILMIFNTAAGRWLDRGIVAQGVFVYQPAGIVLAQFVSGCAFCIRVVKAGFDAFDWRYEEMAMMLGAGPVRSFFKVVLPNVAASLVAGGVITWARIFGLFGPVLLVAGTMRGRTEIMPTTIFLEVSIGRIEVALVIAMLMIVICMAILMVVKRLNGGRAGG